jgi:hypothetical protein
MRIRIARLISIVGHPFVLLSLLIFLPRLERDRISALRVVLVFVGIVCVPLAILMWRCVASGQWTTVDASNRDDRPLLFGASFVVVLISSAYFWFVDRSPSIVRGSMVTAALLLIAAALNRWIKISLHLTFACFCGLILARVRWSYGLGVLLLVPPLVWSRLVLSRHVLPETIGGILLGATGAAVFLCLER